MWEPGSHTVESKEAKSGISSDVKTVLYDGFMKDKYTHTWS